MRYYVSVDIGGTKVAYGLFNEQRQLVARTEHSTDPTWKPDTFAKDIVCYFEQLIAQNKVQKCDVGGMGCLLYTSRCV